VRRGRVWAVAVVLGVLVCTHAWGSGEQLPFAVFVAEQQPEPPLDRFVAGHLGVIEPGWDPRYHYVAYRYLAGPGFDPDEQKVLLAIFNPPQSPEPGPQPEEEWIGARDQVPETPTLDTFEVFAETGEFESFRNCNDDAFRTAIVTLQSMIAKFGNASSQVKKWLDAQDVVFQNCGGTKGHPHIPETLQGGTPFEQAQRAYQIASANFYGEEFDTAMNLFTAIGGDSASPWRAIAPYLAARATLRKATLSGETNDPVLLAQAEKQFMAVAAGKGSDSLKAATQRLLGFIGCRLHPEDRHHQEVLAIMRPSSERTLAQDLRDYTQCGTPRQDGDHPADDLDDWIAQISFQSRLPGSVIDPSYSSHAIDKWKRTGSPAWLAALALTPGSDASVGALLAAAQRVTPDSPAYLTVEFHADRILIEQGKTEEARAKLDTVLAKPDLLTRSAYNQFASLRFKLALNLDEYLKFAQRRLVAIGSEGLTFATDTEELKKWNDPDSILRLVDEPLLDRDSTVVINGWLPLSVLMQMARSSILPREQRKWVALDAWVRAILLGDQHSARELAPLISDLIPELKPSLDAWLAAKTGDQRHFEAALMMLRNPGTRPYVDDGLGRLTPLAQMDRLRDNWWGALSTVPPQPPVSPVALPAAKPPEPKYPMFLSEAERKAADREWVVWSQIDGAEFLCTEALNYARANHDDERVPEALYRCISAVHLSAASDRCDALAEAAFHLLHNRYPGSTWAAKNRFWYHGSGSPSGASIFGR
jgi:hypothetical protein